MEVIDPIKFKRSVKESIFSEVRNSMNKYVKEVPFLHFNTDDISDGELIFSGNIKDFLNSRFILKIKYRKIKTTDGLLIPIKGGFMITINRDGHINRAVTTLAHEVAHTYFYEISDNYPKLIFNEKLLEDNHIYKEFEYLSFEIGRELILPREHFKKYVRYNNLSTPSIQNFVKMYEDFEVVSREILARRIIRDLGLWDSYLFIGYLKDQNLVVKDSDKYRFFAGKFKNLNLKQALENSNQKSLKSALMGAFKRGVDINGDEINCKSEKFNKKCMLDMKLINKNKSRKISFIAMLY